MKAISNGRTWGAVAICAAALLYAFPYFPAINNPNENVRLYMTAAVVEHGSYEISALRSRWGWVNDAACVDHDASGAPVACTGPATESRRYYSVKAPGTSLLGVPGYAAYLGVTDLFGLERDRASALWVLRLTASILPMLVFVFFFHRFLTRRSRHGAVRDATLLAVILGSLLYGYAILFVSHALSAAVAFGAFMILYESRHGRPLRSRASFLAGFLTAAVTLFEYPGLLVSLALAVYAILVLGRSRQLAWFVAGGLIPTLLMMHFQWVAYDSPFTPGHLFVENQSFREAHEEGVFGATGFHADAAFTLLFDRGSGLFPMTPLLSFALLGFPLLLREKKTRMDAVVALVCILGTYTAICFMNNWRGGWTIGPRYLAVVVPFVGWGALRGLEAVAEKSERLGAILALGTAATSIVASGIPSVYYPHLPPEFTVPLSQLFWVLLDHGYAPHNVMNLFGVYGTESMAPLLGIWALAIAWGAAQRDFGRVDGLAVFAGAFLIGGFLIGPLLQAPEREKPVADAVAFVTRSWEPAGHDAASLLDARIRRGSGEIGPEDYAHLAELYAEEGREREAREATRRGELAAERARLVQERQEQQAAP